MPEPSHSAAAEEESLKLLEHFVTELSDALSSLGGTTPNTLLDKYRFWSSKHLQRAADAFVLIRRSKRIDGSKFLVRPALEMALRLEAARQYPELFTASLIPNTAKIDIYYESDKRNCSRRATRIGKDSGMHV